jgi:hypothetical protein
MHLTMRPIRDLHAHRGDDQPLVEYRHADVPADDELIADPLGVWRAISEVRWVRWLRPTCHKIAPCDEGVGANNRCWLRPSTMNA